MLVTVKFPNGISTYTYHCPDDTDVQVGDKVEVPTLYRNTTVEVVQIGSAYVKDIIRVLPRPRKIWHTRVQTETGCLCENDWATVEEAFSYMDEWRKIAGEQKRTFAVFELRQLES